jgi:hypothetical protein
MNAHTGQGKEGTDFAMKTGEMMFHGGHPDHGLTNTGAEDVRMIVVEFKPSKE